MIKYAKYPRTMNCPFSQSNSSDDVWLSSLDHLIGREVVVTEKMDGENTTMYRDYIHARSIDSAFAHHPSRSYVKQIHASIKHLIPEDVRICGENVYAQHAIFYDALPGYFILFNVVEQERFVSWPEVEGWSQRLDLPLVPILYKGILDTVALNKLEKMWPFKSQHGSSEAEGWVIRVVDSFDAKQYAHFSAKYVRPNHVQTNQHWMQQAITINKLRTN